MLQERSEFAGHLKAECLHIRLALQRREMTETDAMRKLAAIRRRREAGAAELRMPLVQRDMFGQGRMS